MARRLATTCAAIAVALTGSHLSAQTGSAPADRPTAFEAAAKACIDSAIRPLIMRARATFPEVIQRINRGLPVGFRPAVTTEVQDSTGRSEQVFIAVDSIRRDTVFGYINSQIDFVRGYHFRQSYVVPVAVILDWTISRPDGTEEGNLLGKYMDDLQDRLARAPQRKPC